MRKNNHLSTNALMEIKKECLTQTKHGIDFKFGQRHLCLKHVFLANLLIFPNNPTFRTWGTFFTYTEATCSSQAKLGNLVKYTLQSVQLVPTLIKVKQTSRHWHILLMYYTVDHVLIGRNNLKQLAPIHLCSKYRHNLAHLLKTVVVTCCS